MSVQSYSFEVFSKERCPQCRATKAWLERRGISYVERDADEHLGMLTDAGVFQAPGVAFAVNGKTVLIWSGFRPGLMSELVSSSVSALKG